MEAQTKRKPLWNHSTFLVITGASRGIGKYIAIAFCRLLHSKSTIVLIARSLSNLEETKERILKINPTLEVQLRTFDLSKCDAQSYRNLLNSCIDEQKQYELYFLVHNAASIIAHIPASKMDDVQLQHEYMSLNLYSVMVLTSVFLDLFQREERCILNMSSSYAVQVRKGAVLYSVSKAAKEMYFKVLAAENPSINILNYSPGPIKTDMYFKMMDESFDPDERTRLQDLLKVDGAVKMEDTIQKLVDVLTKRAYQNGAHVSYFDKI